MKQIKFYEFGPFRVDLEDRTLAHGERLLPITNKSIELLLVLLESEGALLEKDVLMQRLWPDQMVEESNLTQHVYSLRKALGEDGSETRYIQTVPRRGYRFTGEIKKVPRVSAQPEVVSVPQVTDERPTPVKVKGLSHFSLRQRGLKRWVLPFSVVAIFSSAIIYSRYLIAKRLAIVEISQLTQRSDIVSAATSPDGQFLAYFTEDIEGKEGLWLKQTTNQSELALVPVSATYFREVAFSRDGTYLYYTQAENAVAPGALYRYALPGGPAQRMLEGVAIGAFALSPQSDRVAFTRHDTAKNISHLYVADLNGANPPRELTSVPLPDLLRTPSWSPDGKWIACTRQQLSSKPEFMTVTVVDAATGQQSDLKKNQWWRVTDLTWLSMNEGLVIAAIKESSGFSQLWQLSWPSGESWQLTNGTSNYGDVSASSDGKGLVAVESKVSANIWVTAPRQPQAQPHKLFTTDANATHGVATTKDGKVLYTTNFAGGWDIWSLSLLGGMPRRLTENAKANFMQSASADGKSIIFSSNRTGRFNIWAMQSDGSHPQQLTQGEGESSPRFAPDGSWFLYTTGDSAMRSVWRQKTTGGQPVKIAEGLLQHPIISPDGNLVAYIVWQGHSGAIKVIPALGGEPVYQFDVDTAHIQWRPDGKAITFSLAGKEAGNLWDQPLSGGTPQQVTFFNNENLYGFDWVPDGQQIVCVRGTLQQNAVRLKLAD